MRKREDEFDEKTKKILGQRCGYICSNPGCRLLTVGAHSEPEKSCSIGVASHIEAASENGPRYNPNMTSQERRSLKNGIWLCFNCSKKIDSDKDLYSVELLKKWKLQAESDICLGSSKLKGVQGNKAKVIAIANAAGGVAKSFTSAALAYSLYEKTGKKVLCISVAQLDNAPMALGIDYEEMKSLEKDKRSKAVEELDILKSPIGVDAVCKYSIENNRYWQEHNFGTATFSRLLKYLVKNFEYQYIVCDCGRGDTLIAQDILLNADDVIIPIGYNVNSYRGGLFVVAALKQNNINKRIWILHAMGFLAQNDKILYEQFLRLKQLALEIDYVRVKDFVTIVPYNKKVSSLLSEKRLFEHPKIQNVSEAYKKVIDELLNSV
ncbi:MAG: ParA family protein [Paenibacillaceae bacterium]|nr:ParA family protein [Paenibacillaceae bacterium]